jgi:two-component system, NtrC family, sensor histidine kinase HydH
LTPAGLGGEGGNPAGVPPDNDPGRRPLPPDLARLLHDVRGPLNSLTLHVKLLESADDATTEAALRTAKEQLARLTEMLPAAFAVIALEAAPPRPVDLGAIMEVAREQAGGQVTLANTSWPTLHGDEGLLALAVSHLLRNALEATPPGRPWPLVSAKVAGNETLIEVRDWGMGLPTTNPKLLIKLMHSTKRGHRGLGLVTVERIARLHQGALRFDAPPEGGALITLALPVAK